MCKPVLPLTHIHTVLVFYFLDKVLVCFMTQDMLFLTFFDV